jgi:hypothetical protein
MVDLPHHQDHRHINKNKLIKCQKKELSLVI